MVIRDTTTRLLDSLADTNDALIEALRAANERRSRFRRSLIEGARQGQRELLHLGRRWLEAPTDVFGFGEALAETVANAQVRALALAQEWLGDVAQSQREAREVLQRARGEVQRAWGEVRETVERFQAERPPWFLRASREPSAEPSP